MPYPEFHAKVGITPSELKHASTNPEWVSLPVKQDVLSQTVLRQHIYYWGIDDYTGIRREHDRRMEVKKADQNSVIHRLRLFSGESSVVVYDIEKNDLNHPEIKLEEIYAGNLSYKITAAALTATDQESAINKYEIITKHLNKIFKEIKSANSWVTSQEEIEELSKVA